MNMGWVHGDSGGVGTGTLGFDDGPRREGELCNSEPANFGPALVSKRFPKVVSPCCEWLLGSEGGSSLVLSVFSAMCLGLARAPEAATDRLTD